MKLSYRKKNAFIMFSLFLVLFIKTPGSTEETKRDGLETEKNSIDAEVTLLLESAGEDEIVLPLKLALGTALESNLDIQIEKVSIPISEKTIIERQARFDY